MDRIERSRLLIGIVLLGISLFLLSCGKKLAHEGKVVFTQVPVTSISIDQLKAGAYRYIPGMQIALTNLADSPARATIISKDFYSARAPEISYDGNNLLFSGQQERGAPWQIWQLDFENEVVNQITYSDQHCTDPLWLPDGRIAYSKQVVGDDGRYYHVLFSCFADGSDEQRLTFQPHEDIGASMLHDGRLLVSSRQLYPMEGSVKFLAIHPDGTKAELFYQPLEQAGSISKARESAQHEVFVAESGKLILIDFKRPLHSRQVLNEESQDIFLSVFPVNEQKVIVSVLQPDGQSAGLSIIELADAARNPPSFFNSKYHALEPVLVTKGVIPKKLPSTINTDLESGYFVCMDVHRMGNGRISPTSILQIQGIDRIIGETEVEEDGSFYVELKADQPVRFQTMDADGEPVNEPSSWMWVRPNERRGCIGCHEDRELAPENTIPKAIEKLPVSMIK